MSDRRLLLLFGLLLVAVFAACQPEPSQVEVVIAVDGERQSLTTEAATVREALDEAGVELGSQDRVEPDLYVALAPGLVIEITRVREAFEVEREVVPFERQTVVNEALAPGETRLAQLGANGEEEITFRVVYEDDEAVSRTEVSRVISVPPAPEILVIGPQESLPSIQIDGVIAYLSNGNAWLMRDSSSSRRAVTSGGNLDGHAFGLSPDGRQMLYTTTLTDEIELPLNDMWLASTTIVGEPPITTGIRGVLHARWSPVVSQSLLAYSTAERTPNPPGWQANNDLWLATIPPFPVSEPDKQAFDIEPVEIVPANTQGLYPWWGTSFEWSPDGSQLAYARADQIGVITLLEEGPTISSTVTPLLDFAPLQTLSDWVWVPSLSWSPDGQFIAATVHGPPLAAEDPEESQVFDLWLLSADGELSAKVAEQVGMWANPDWGEAGIVYGRALEPLQSVNSRYAIQVMDRDGSNRRQIFPFQAEPGVQFPELAWSPDEENLLFIYNGNLHITGRSGGAPRQVSTDGQVSQPQWAIAAPLPLTGTVALTTSQTLTGSSALSGTITPTATASRTPTVTATRTGTATATRTVTPTSRPTNTATRRAIATRTATAAPTRTPTPPNETAQATGTPARTASPTSTATRQSTATRTSTSTSEPAQATGTPTPTVTPTSAGD